MEKAKRDRRQQKLSALTVLLAQPLQKKSSQSAAVARRRRTNAVIAHAALGAGLTHQQVEQILDQLKMRAAITRQMNPVEINRLLTALTSHPDAVALPGPPPLLPVPATRVTVRPTNIVSATRLSLQAALGVDEAALTLAIAACGVRDATTADRFDPPIAARITTAAQRMAPLSGQLLGAPLFEPTAQGIITPAQFSLVGTPRWAQLARIGLVPPEAKAQANPGRRWPQIAGYAQALALHRAIPFTDTISGGEPLTAPSPSGTDPTAAAAFPACAQLLKTGPHLKPADVAVLYTTLSELTFYHSDPETAAVRHIAAEKFGIHTSPAAGKALNAQAIRTVADGRAKERMEDLTRLARRPYGLFYDAHRRRVSLWDSRDNGAVLLYTTTMDEILTCARQAVDTRDPVPPAVTKTVAWPGMETIAAEDPGLVLAETAYHLGTLPARSYRPSSAPTSTHRMFPEITGAQGELVDYARLDWLVPLAGPMGCIHLQFPQETFDRDPRRRPSPHQVREHRRRAPGTSPTAVPDVRVRGYMTGIGGPLKPSVTAATTKGRGQRP